MRFPGPKAALLVVAMAAAAVALPVLAAKPDAGAATSQAGAAAVGAADVYCSTAGSQASKVMPWQPDGYLDAEDTSKTLQGLINSASSSGGAIVQLPEGLFLLDRPLLVKSNVALKGSGPGTVLKAAPGFLASKGPFGGHPLITTNGARNVTIADLTADHSGDELDGNTPGRLTEYLVDVRYSSNALVEGVSTRNPFTYSIAVVASSNFCVRHNRTSMTSTGAYDQLDGIHITDSHGGLVEGNTIDQRQGADGDDGLVAQTLGAPVHDVTYRGNKVRGGSHGAGMQLAVGRHEIFNIVVEDNEFWDSPYGVHTGYYDGNAAVHNVVVKNNSFTDISGAWLDFHGELRDISVSDNRTCRTGGMKLADGAGTFEANNRKVC